MTACTSSPAGTRSTVPVAASSDVGESGAAPQGTQSSPYRWSARGAVSRAPAGSGRSVSAAAVSTGAPAASVTSSRTASAPARVMRTRTRTAPTACSRTPDQANGSSGPSVAPVSSRSPNAAACRQASSRAGCSPYAPASSRSGSGSSASARISPSPRQTARRPRKAGPYGSPRPASVAYASSASTATGPGGGQAPAGPASVNCAPAGPSGARVPVAWAVHSSPSRSRACTVTGRRPRSSGGSSTTRTGTMPSTGTGAWMTSSSRTGQPTWSPARMAISTRPVPGSSTWSKTRWSSSHGRPVAESRPLTSVAPRPGTSRTASSSGWPTMPRPSAAASAPWPAGRAAQ